MFKAYYECLNSGLAPILLVKSKMEAKKYKLAFNLNEAINENILISGCNRSGKSNLAMNVASILQTLGQVIVVDSSGIWKRKSDIPLYYHIKYRNQSYPIMKRQSIVYDTSYLRSTEQKEFLNDLTDAVWYRNLENPQQTWLIIEESSNFCRNVRGRLSENILRIASVGRNIGVRLALITIDLALIDVVFTRLSSQRFHGKLNIEANSKRRFKAYYGKDWQYIATHDLETGWFIWLSEDKLQVVKTPLFTCVNKPRQYIMPKPKRTFVDNWQPKRRKHWIEKLLGVISGDLPNPFEVFLNDGK